VHPTNRDIVYVAALLRHNRSQIMVYRTMDAEDLGARPVQERQHGAPDLAMDPTTRASCRARGRSRSTPGPHERWRRQRHSDVPRRWTTEAPMEVADGDHRRPWLRMATQPRLRRSKP
jgi:hypothetical protein